MRTPTPWQSYRLMSAQTASPGQLVLMLYDGAIRAMESALAGFENQDPLELNETVNNNILRAQAIVSELDSCLDLERGGELAVVLRRLYVYIDERLQQSNLRKTPEGVREALRHLDALRGAWGEMLQQPKPRATGAVRGNEPGLCVCG